MSDKLSQEEISALIAGLGGAEGDGDPSPAAAGDERLHVLADRLGGAFAAGTSGLATLIGRGITLSAPLLREVPAPDVRAALGARYVLARAEFTSGLSGVLLLCLAESDAARLGALLLGEESGEPPEFKESHPGAIGEAVNQLVGAAASELAKYVGATVAFAPPEVLSGEAAVETVGAELAADARMPFGDLAMQIEGLPPIPIQIVLQPGLLDALAPAPRAAPAPPAEPALAEAAAAAAPVRELRPVTRPAVAPQSPRPAAPPPASGGAPVQVRSAAFDEIGGQAPAAESQNIDLLLDVPLQLTVELGRARRQIRDVLAMGPGSVVELDRLAGEAVDVLVNGKLVAKGEVVVIDENFGVRITDIISRADRIRNL